MYKKKGWYSYKGKNDVRMEKKKSDWMKKGIRVERRIKMYKEMN